MSYLLSDVITRVQQKLDDSSFDTQTLINFANDTEREIFNRYRINLMEHQYDNIVTVTGSRDLSSLPTSPPVQTYIQLIINLPVNYSKVIPYIEYEDAAVDYPNFNLIGMGPPIAWFMFAGVPTLLNRADKVYTISARYTIQPTPLTAVGDTPNIPEEFSELLVLGMFARALEFNDAYDQSALIRVQYRQLAVDYVDATRRQAGVSHTMRQPRNLNAHVMNR